MLQCMVSSHFNERLLSLSSISTDNSSISQLDENSNSILFVIFSGGFVETQTSNEKRTTGRDVTNLVTVFIRMSNAIKLLKEPRNEDIKVLVYKVATDIFEPFWKTSDRLLRQKYGDHLADIDAVLHLANLLQVSKKQVYSRPQIWFNIIFILKQSFWFLIIRILSQLSQFLQFDQSKLKRTTIANDMCVSVFALLPQGCEFESGQTTVLCFRTKHLHPTCSSRLSIINEYQRLLNANMQWISPILGREGIKNSHYINHEDMFYVISGWVMLQ